MVAAIFMACLRQWGRMPGDESARPCAAAPVVVRVMLRGAWRDNGENVQMLCAKLAMAKPPRASERLRPPRGAIPGDDT